MCLCGFAWQVIKKQMEEGVSKRRVGFISKGAPARQHSEIQTPDGQKVTLLLSLFCLSRSSSAAVICSSSSSS